MSFSFNFASDELDEEQEKVTRDDAGAEKGREEAQECEKNIASVPWSGSHSTRKHALADLIATLPPRISYSCLEISRDERSDKGQSGGSAPIRLYRRDLFDARFQLIQEADDGSSDEADEEEADARQSTGRRHLSNEHTTIDAASDLVPGEYEGGLKTWECALDLVKVLSQRSDHDGWSGKRVLELGCGTALPSMFLFQEALGKEEEVKADLSFDLCDFNEQVLRLVTLPNLLLTWYMRVHEKNVAAHAAVGDIVLTSELLDSFKEDLAMRNITFCFYSGPWQGLADAGALARPPLSLDQPLQGTHDIILTSETIYSMESLPALVDTLELAACGPATPLEGRIADMALASQDAKDAQKSGLKANHPLSTTRTVMTLVAAKVLYFGVGGGVMAFQQELGRRHRLHGPARAETVWKSERGVSRVVLSVDWPQ